jgi:cobalt-zinc-cadmium efflux system protein
VAGVSGSHRHGSHAHGLPAHAGHSHGVEEGADARRLGAALALIVSFMVAEVVAGILADSLALLSDAAHMLVDAGALLLSLLVLRLVRRPAQGNVTFGLRRMDVLSAQANGATLLVLAGLIAFGAVDRLVHPSSPGGWTMLVVALAGVAVNLLATRQVARANRSSMNVEGSYQHLLTDLYAFAATAIAAVVILTAGFVRADPIAALLVAVLMVRAAVGLLRASGRVLLEIAPEGVDVEEIGRAMAGHPRVTEVHDLHVWEIGTSFPALSAHVLVDPDADCHGIRRELEQLLEEQFGVDHTTLQVDHARTDRLLQIGEPPRERH